MAIMAARRRPGAAHAEHVLLMGLIAAVALAAAGGLAPVVIARFESGVAAFAGPGAGSNGR